MFLKRKLTQRKCGFKNIVSTAQFQVLGKVDEFLMTDLGSIKHPANMKIRSFILLASLLTFFASGVFAKENDIKSNLNTDLGSKKKDNREEIAPLDFAKLFSEAEGYFKAAKAWNKIKCEPKTGFICTKHECKKRDIKSTIILDKKAKTVTRCEKENCESFEAEFDQTGVFYNIQTKGPIGTLIRVLGDSRYKEVSTVALDAYVANGECVVVADEAE